MVILVATASIQIFKKKHNTKDPKANININFELNMI